MTSMTQSERIVIGGVDTHAATHHCAVIDTLGRHLGDREFPATRRGYRDLIGWLSSHGRVQAVGVEGTGSYGAELSRTLRHQGLDVTEVNRPDRAARRARGKSDPIDAYAAAGAVLSGRATATPKTRDGIVEAIRVLRVARTSAVKARTQALNQARQLIVTGPDVLRARLAGLTKTTLGPACAGLRPGPDRSDPETATKTALRSLGRRIATLTAEITALDTDLTALTKQAAPQLLAINGVGVEVAGQILVTAGDNPERLHTEAAFAHLCGVAPIPASSGQRHRHRLNRGGDRAANCALHIIVLSRMASDARTRAYVTRRTTEGLSTKDIIRCLKRHVAREIYHALTRTPTTTTTYTTAA